MIGWFPDPYSDELFYSMFARYFDRMSYPNASHTSKELFGRMLSSIKVYMANNLDYLIQVLPPGNCYTADLLIDLHTLLPFCSPFYAPYLIKKIREEIKNDYTKFTFYKPRITHHNYLRFCPECFIEDKQQFGESYWHRLHQLPGVEICHIHGVILATSQVATFYSNQLLILADKAKVTDIKHSPKLSDHNYKIFINLAKNADWLLKQSNLISFGDSMRKRCLNLVFSKYKSLDFKNKVFLQKFLNDFIDFYSPEILEALHCELPDKSINCWLIDIFIFDGKINNPLYYLLLITFLGYTSENFFKLPVEDKDISNYVLPVKKIKVKYSNYWEFALKNLWNNQLMNISEIAQELGVNEDTINRQATYLNLHCKT
ncbi:Tn7-like transposition protein D [Calothrix sp. NIES-2100]|uniref:TnsD family Tn7-like transposition protein n=1 Tax=Calothrix sp. NIES-2100 TaxID=1954172 RepID=UPI000B5F46C0|nr:Tn7-like transposition protein D [Calothrix sp. NIES-2100]